jgi:hypothetical protein
MNNKKRAAECRKLGMTQELQVIRDTDDPHPGDGGSRGYPLWYRCACIDACRANNWDYAAVVAVGVCYCKVTRIR